MEKRNTKSTVGFSFLGPTEYVGSIETMGPVDFTPLFNSQSYQQAQ